MIMMALGPKSKNGNGVEDSSTTAPDQGDGMMEEKEPGEKGDNPGDEEEDGENMLDLPAGFKAPEASSGGYFTTTMEAKEIDTSAGRKLLVRKVGGMPISGPEEQNPDEEPEMEEPEPMEQAGEDEESPALSSQRKMMTRRQSDEMKARKVFQGR